MTDTDQLVFNGIDGTTGNYLVPPKSTQDVIQAVLGEVLDKDELAELNEKTLANEVESWGVRRGVDPTDLNSAGWGIIFADTDADQNAKIKDALRPLLTAREDEAGALYKEFIGPDAYLEGESKSDFLARFDKGPGDADPRKVPYYLLIAADPESVSFRFQYQLDVDYAVGRIHFSDIDSYAAYANSVVRAEQGQPARDRTACFFAVENRHDKATRMSSRKLVAPLIEVLNEDMQGWDIQSHFKRDATKDCLSQVLADPAGPAFLFTASHGLGFPKGHALQERHQGALLCDEWPGPLQWPGDEIPVDHYYSADDLGEPDLSGLISFHFACFGAGTPRMDDFDHSDIDGTQHVAEEPFLAKLPTAMLSSKEGGALAVVGHVERAWGYSFMWPRAGEQIDPFHDSIATIMDGLPVGYAMEHFDNRYASISTELNDMLYRVKRGGIPDKVKIAGMWTANNDARSYVVLGDPAVRLQLD